MNTVIRLALVGASLAALAVPALAQNARKTDRMQARPAITGQTIAPVALGWPTPSTVRSGTDWDARQGYDRASSPYGHGGY
jgi:hypothetical protein